MTNNSIFGAFALSGSLLLGLGGCTEFIAENNDPNNFTDNTLELALRQAALATASPSNQHTARIATMFSDQFTGSDRQYISISNYQVDASDFDATWEDIYQRGLPNAQFAKNRAQEAGIEPLVGAATAFEAYFFGEAAMLFGDVPFTQANKIEEFQNPTYEPQAQVLQGAIALLDEAIAKAGARKLTADGTSAAPVWVSTATYGQFANGLKARYYLGLKDYANALAAAEASGMDTNEESAKIRASSDNYGENLYWQFEVEQRSDYLSIGNSRLRLLLSDTTAASRKNSKTNDAARYKYFVGAAAGGIIRLNTTNGFAAIDAPMDVITSREMQLIIAESAARLGQKEKAIKALNTARELWDSLLGGDNYQDYVEADFAAGGIAARPTGTADETLIYRILEEKFVSVIGLPTYYDVLRTKNLIGARVKGANPNIPQRYLYPLSERSSNSNLRDQTPPGLFDPLPING